MKCAILIALLILELNWSAQGAIAYDDASQGAYADGWQAADNGGSGFGAWAFTTSGNGGQRLGTSANNGGSGNVDVSGTAWGLWSYSTLSPFSIGSSEARRSISTPLSTGQSFLIRLDVGNVGTLGSVGFSIDNGTTARMTLSLVGGGGYFNLTDSGLRNTTIPSSTHVVDVAVAITGANSYSIDLNNGAYSYSGTMAGSGDINSVNFFNRSAGNGIQYDFFFNSMDVTAAPEPALTGTLALLVIGVSVVARHLRSQRGRPSCAVVPKSCD